MEQETKKVDSSQKGIPQSVARNEAVSGRKCRMNLKERCDLFLDIFRTTDELPFEFTVGNYDKRPPVKHAMLPKSQILRRCGTEVLGGESAAC